MISGQGDAILCPCEKDMMRLPSPADTEKVERSAVQRSSAARSVSIQMHNHWTGQEIGSVVWLNWGVALEVGLSNVHCPAVLPSLLLHHQPLHYHWGWRKGGQCGACYVEDHVR